MKPRDQDNDWQFWAAVLVVGIVLCAGLTVFHRYTELGRSLSVDGLAMIGTTLVAAAIGFLAILLQVRSSSRQLRDQIKAQGDAEREELERQMKSLARAFLFEIDDYYHYSLNQEPNWEKKVFKFERWPFLMYQANAGRIGNFDDRTIKAIIKFYGDAEAYQASFAEFVVTNDAALLGKDPVDVEAAHALRGRLKERFPALKRSAEGVCASLSDVAGVPRANLRVPLSGFDDSSETKKKGQETAHNA